MSSDWNKMHIHITSEIERFNEAIKNLDIQIKDNTDTTHKLHTEIVRYTSVETQQIESIKLEIDNIKKKIDDISNTVEDLKKTKITLYTALCTLNCVFIIVLSAFEIYSSL